MEVLLNGIEFGVELVKKRLVADGSSALDRDVDEAVHEELFPQAVASLNNTNASRQSQGWGA